MNLRSIDLNLLTLLHALLEEQHVSRAAERAGLTQPAMSNALERCRKLFDDPLLERRGKGMGLTPRALALRAPLAAVLCEIGGLVDARPPTLERIERTVTIVMADALSGLLIDLLLDHVAREAPGVTLAFRHWGSGAAAMAEVREGAADLAVSVFPVDPRGDLVVEPILEERYVLAGRTGHPALIASEAEGWLDYPFVVVSAAGTVRTPFDDQLAQAGLSRRVAIAVPSFLLVPSLLVGSDRLALLPSLMLERHRVGLASRSPPIAPPGFRLDLIRHPRNRSDAAVDFVARCVRMILSEHSAAGSISGPLQPSVDRPIRQKTGVTDAASGRQTAEESARGSKLS